MSDRIGTSALRTGSVGGGNLNLQSTPIAEGPIASIGKGETVVVGRARVVKDPKNIPEFDSGDILVAEITTPDFTPLFRIAGGVITDSGGITSHAAITAREFRIPALVGVGNATRVIKDGDIIAIDISGMRAGSRNGKVLKVG